MAMAMAMAMGMVMGILVRRNRARWRAGAVVCAAVVLSTAACVREGIEEYADLDLRDSPLSTHPGPRVISQVEWQSVFRIGGTESDTTLYRPSFISADDEGLYLYDSGSYQVLRISAAGEVEWTFGRRGGGPDEFRTVRDLEVGPLGHLWVLDPDNARVTILRRDGEVEARIPLTDIPHTEEVIPLSDRQALLLAVERERPLYLIDRSGKVIDRLEIPWDGFRRLHPLAAQMIAATDPTGAYFALAFRLGDGFFVFKDGEPQSYHGVFVEHTRFPSVRYYKSGNIAETTVERAPDTAASLDLHDGRLFVHFGGETEDDYELIDIYSLESGEYERSLRLPRWLSHATLGGGLVYGLYTNPYPALEAWRPLVDGAGETTANERG